MYFLYPTPPYALLVAGLLAGLACGFAFATTLKSAVRSWAATDQQTGLAKSTLGLSLQVPYAGMMGGICFFLSCGVQIFGVGGKVAYGIAIVLTLFTAQLVWKQLSSMLQQIEENGFGSLDLEDMF
ncbi:hypothetical protein [Prochlorothrix hollandica]|uniref:Uncharacterized protein n=1 Tax=Prochlorothrix hollandica PCC 9006 = CALU 1027 TaxID=317619 RepID=A0A0M2PW53_PROHO|nr:hypothetical protein [Prochlorothrix hollandica]KKI98606.1 hypothetical protein PROH_17115 [Prochlorothrix hollandica PCC 9006 = CALU 1027]